MRLVHLGVGKIDIVRGDQWQVHRIGHLDGWPLRQPLCLGQLPCLGRMALQLDIQPVAKDASKPRHQRLSPDLSALPQQPAHRPVRPARQADQPVGMLGKFHQRHMRPIRLAQIKARVQFHEALVAPTILGQQHHRRGAHGFLARRGRLIGQIDLAAHDRLHAPIQRRHG